MRGRPFHFDDLSGGVNLKDAAYLLDTKQARDLLNVVSRSQGAIRRRDGAVQFIAGPVRGVAAVEVFNQPMLMASRADGFTVYSPTGSVIASASATAEDMEWVTAPGNGGQGPVWGVDGSIAHYFDGSAFGTWTAASGSLPAGGKYLKYVENRMVVVTPTLVQASDVGNPRDWDTSDGGSWAVQLDPTDGSDFTGVGTAGPDLLVFKQSKVFVIYDMTTGANRRISTGVGCASHRSIAESPHGTFFLAEDGVWVTDGNSVTRVSHNIDPLLEDIVPTRRDRAAGVWFNDRYYLSICTSGNENNLTLEYDPVRKSWWIHDLAASQWTSWHRVTGEPAALYGSHPQRQWVFAAFVPGVDHDGPLRYSAFWKSGWHSFGSPYRRKRCRMAHFDGEGEFSVYASRDFEVGDTLIGTANFNGNGSLFAAGDGVFGGTDPFGGVSNVGEGRALNPGVARVWSLVVASDKPFATDSYTLLMTDRKD